MSAALALITVLVAAVVLDRVANAWLDWRLRHWTLKVEREYARHAVALAEYALERAMADVLAEDSEDGQALRRTMSS